MKQPCKASHGQGIELCLYDDSAQTHEQLLYCSRWHDIGPQGNQVDRPAGYESGQAGFQFPLAGRQWRIECRPSKGFLVSNRSMQPWAVLAGGVMFTGLLGAFLLIMTGRTARIEEMVQERTAQLHRANEDLHHHIAERERSEQALQEQYQIQKALIRNIPGLVFFKSREHVYITANQGFCEMTETTIEEIEGKTDYDLFSRDLADKFRADDRDVLASGVPKLLIEERAEGPGDKELWVSTSKSPYFNAAGEVAGLVGVAIDITDRKLAEEMLGKAYANLESTVRERTSELVKANESLRATETRQKAILNNIPDIAWLKDRDCRFIAVNQPFSDACGVPAAGLVGKSDFDIWQPELARLYRQDDLEVIESQSVKRVEEPLLDAEGRESWIETIKTPIFNEQGEVIGTTGIARDITQRKKTEAMQQELFQEVARQVAERTAELADANVALKTAHDQLG